MSARDTILQHAQDGARALEQITPEFFWNNGDVKLRTSIEMYLGTAERAVARARAILNAAPDPEIRPPFADPHRGPKLVTR